MLLWPQPSDMNQLCVTITFGHTPLVTGRGCAMAQYPPSLVQQVENCGWSNIHTLPHGTVLLVGQMMEMLVHGGLHLPHGPAPHIPYTSLLVKARSYTSTSSMSPHHGVLPPNSPAPTQKSFVLYKLPGVGVNVPVATQST